MTISSFGWDLAGYGSSGSGLCRADREGNSITATILRAPFVCCPRHKFDSSIRATSEIEVEMLRRFGRVGSTYLDVPIDLQSLLRIVDLSKDEQAECYWELVKRPVDQAFDALEPLGSNLGFAVARAAHILGRLAAQKSGLVLGVNLFETYPAATLQLVTTTNTWTAANYKGGMVENVCGQWRGQASKKKSLKARHAEEGKSSGLAVLANNLGLKAAEGFQMNDDEFDAVLCAITGCIPECVIRGEALAVVIKEKLAPNQPSEPIKFKPPHGYEVFDKLPSGIIIEVKSEKFTKPDELFAAIEGASSEIVSDSSAG